MLVGLLVLPLQAQESGEDVGRAVTITLRGTVVDLEAGSPLSGAFIAPRGLVTGFLTDSLGRFALEVPSAAVHYLYVERLGYMRTDLQVSAEDAAHPLRILVRPDPVLLQGVEVLVDRWEQRRRFYPGSVRAFGQRTLLTAGARDALDFVRARAGARIRTCPGDPLTSCVWRRGRIRKMTVCIDDMPMFDGGAALETFRPQDFYMIEVYDQGLQVRVYTEHYVEQMARRGSPVRPLIMGC